MVWMFAYLCISSKMIADIEFPLELLMYKMEIVSIRKLCRYNL